MALEPDHLPLRNSCLWLVGSGGCVSAVFEGWLCKLPHEKLLQQLPTDWLLFNELKLAHIPALNTRDSRSR